MIKQISKPHPESKASQAREGTLKKAMEPKDIWEILKPQLQTLVQECAWVVSMDVRGHILGITEIGRGAVDHVEVEPREVFRPAIELAATFCMLVHNHPSDETDPSNDDIRLSKNLIKAGAILGVPFVDHIIVGKSGYTALSEQMPEFQNPYMIP